MKRIIFRFIQTFVLITALITNLAPGVVQAGLTPAANTEAAIADETPGTSGDPVSVEVEPQDNAGLYQTPNPQSDCAITATIQYYNPGKEPAFVDPALTPLITDDDGNSTGKNYNIPPGQPNSPWGPDQDITPAEEPPLDNFSFYQLSSSSNSGVTPYADVRMDTSTNRRVLRGNEVVVVIAVINSLGTFCNITNSHTVDLKSLRFKMESSSGVFYDSPALTASQFINNVGAPATNGTLRYVTSSAAPDAYLYYTQTVTIPPTVTGRVTATVYDTVYSCNVPNFCTGNDTKSTFFNNYFAFVGGPLVTGNLKVVGGPGGRLAGQTAWFVLEVNSLSGNGSDYSSVSTITDSDVKSLAECRNLAVPADPEQGWFREPLTPSFTTIETFSNPFNGGQSAGNTRLTYNVANAPAGTDTTNMGLGINEKVYCVFKRILTPNAEGNYVLDAQMRVTSYNPGGANPLVAILPVSISFPVGEAALEVTKTIIGPTDPDTGEVKQIISPGEIVTYQITIRNVGQVTLDNLSFSDSLTGVQPAAATSFIIYPLDDNGNCPNPTTNPCLVTNQVQYAVPFNAPDPLVNFVEARGRIVGSTIFVTDQAVASIPKADSELAIEFAPLTDATAPGGDGYQPGERIRYEMTYCNSGLEDFTSITFVGQTPSKRNPNTAAENFAIEDALPNFPIVEEIINGQITRPNPLPFEPGCYGPIIWEYTIPNLPTYEDPVFQQVRLRANRSDGSVIFQDAQIVTPLTNNSIQIEAQLWDPVLNAPRTTTGNTFTVLRGENLFFDLRLTNLSNTRRCNVTVRWYTFDPATGVTTPISIPINLNWPGAERELEASSTTIPGGNVATTISDIANSPNAYRPQFQVDATTPTPLIIIFEADATQNCAGGTESNYLTRDTVIMGVSNIQVSSSIQIQDVQQNNIAVTEGRYPEVGAPSVYRISYVATNIGSVPFTITNLRYCLLSGPTGDPQNCSSGTAGLGGLTMLDDSEGNNFEIDNNDPQSRTFLTLETRSDLATFDLALTQEQINQGQGWANPLVIQVIIEGTDNQGSAVLIRDSVIFPLAQADLAFRLSGPSTLVRGDAGVPIQFSLANVVEENGVNLTNVRVLNLMEPVADGAGAEMPPNSGFPAGQDYEVCTFDVGGQAINIAANDTSAKNGTCSFDFTSNIPVDGNILTFRAAAIATKQGTTTPIADITILQIEVVPHLLVTKTGVDSQINTEPIPFTVTVTNNSAYQDVYFDAQTGFRDTFSPQPTGPLCVGTTCPGLVPSIASFTGMTNVLSRYVLAPTQTASMNYVLGLPTTGEILHNSERYNNTATLVGEAENGGEVSGSDSWRTSLQCPLLIRGFALEGGDPTRPSPLYSRDGTFTLGEEVFVRIIGTNLGSSDIVFSSYLDTRYKLDVDPAVTDMINLIDWPVDSQPGLLPAAQPNNPTSNQFTYEFVVKVRAEDFLDDTGNPVVSNQQSLDWPFYYQTNLAAPLPCGDSTPLSAAEWNLPIFNPVVMTKTSNTQLAFSGQTVNYSMTLFNRSEVVDIAVEALSDPLFGTAALAVTYPGGTTSTTGGILPRYVVTSGGGGTGIELANSGPHPYVIQIDDPERLTNTATVTYHALANAARPPFVTDEQLQASASNKIQTENPLLLSKVVISPIDRIAPRGTEVQYLITISNGSAYGIQNVTVTDDKIDPSPLCTPTTSTFCLGTEFNLSPGQQKQLLVNHVIVDSPTNSYVNTVTALGTLNVEGSLFVLPPVIASASVSLTPPVLTITPAIYKDAQCQSLLVDDPLRDRNDDDIPEANVGELIYYGFAISVGGGKRYENVNVFATLGAGDTSLQNELRAYLIELAQNGTNPYVSGDAANIIIRDDNSTAVDAPPEVFRCIPHLLATRQPDPLPLEARIVGLDDQTDLESAFTAEPVLLDVGDANIFITKTVTPISAYPGREVTYRILIENRSPYVLEINDVWDTMLGGQLFFDTDGNPDTAPAPGDYQNNPANTSIPFDQPFNTTTGVGWTWTSGQVGILEQGDTATYVYKRTVMVTDPDPTINRAGVLATVLNPQGAVPASDEAINSLAVSPSQLRVTKTARPTTTILGSNVSYTITVTNVGDNTPIGQDRRVGDVFDVIVWDDRYNLQFPGQTRMIANNPGSVAIQGGAELGGEPGANDLRPFETMFITYTLPTIPNCVRWDNNQPNIPWSPTDPDGYASGTCQEYDEATQTYGSSLTLAEALPLIDPFINTAYAIGKIDDPATTTSELVYLEIPGSDTAIVDLINPALRIEKVPFANVATGEIAGGASIGADIEYGVRITNTGSNMVRIDRVVDVPDANIPPGNTITTEIPLEAFRYETCVVDTFEVEPNTVTNLSGRSLIPATEGGTSTLPLQVDQSALLPPGCSAYAYVTIQIPDPSPSSEYTNVVQVEAVELNATLTPLVDLSSASLDIRNEGLVVTKRAFNCNTAPNGINTPQPDPSLPPGPGETANQVCTVNTAVGASRPGAQQIVAQEEGEDVWYEIFIRNAGTDAYNRLSLRDVMMIDNGGTTTEAPVWNLPTGQAYTAWNWAAGAPGQTYTWQNGTLLIRDNTAGVNGDGPFGPDDPATPDIDESNFFEPGEIFGRPDPGPLDPTKGNVAPVITYLHTLTLPEDDPNGEPYRYLNRISVTGSGENTPTPVQMTTGSSTYTVQILPAQVEVTYTACVESGGSASVFDVDEGLPCNTIAQPGEEVWYRIAVENTSNLNMSDFAIADTVRGLIPNTDACWFSDVPSPTNPNPTPGWAGGTAGFLYPGGRAVCTYKRTNTEFAPLQVSDDPYTTSVTANFNIANTPPTVGAPVTASTTIRVVSGQLLVTIIGCETPVTAAGGLPQTFDIRLENLGTGTLTNVVLRVPDANGVLTPTDVGTLDPAGTATAVRLLDNALTFTVPNFGPSSSLYQVFASGNLAVVGGVEPVEASATCEAQRISGTLLVNKEVITGDGSSVAQPGDTVTYRITLENQGTQPINNIAVSDLRIQTSATNVAWNWGTSLGAGSSVSQEFTYVIPAGEDPVINTVTVTGTSGTNRLLNSDQARLDIATGEIVALATGQPNPVLAGNTITFNYEVCNRSTTNSYVLASVTDADPSGTPVTTPGGTAFAPGVSLAPLACVQYVRSVETAATDAGRVISRALLASACPAANPTCAATEQISDGQTASVNVVNANATLFVSLTPSRTTAAAGETITYSLVITNVSSQNVSLTSVTSALGLAWGFPSTTLRPGESVTKTQTYTVPATPTDPIVENISVGFQRADATTGTQTASASVYITSVAGSALLLVIDVPANIQAGGVITYTYRVTNMSNTVISDAYLTLNPPQATAGAACASPLTGSGWTNGGSTNLIPPMPVGFTAIGTATCTAVGSLNPGDQITHIGSVNRTSLTPPLQDEATATTTVISPLSVTISSDGLIVPGGMATFTYTLQNAAGVSISGVTIVPTEPDICVAGTFELVNSSDEIWSSGATIPASQAVTYSARCQVKADFLSVPPPPVGSREFLHSADIFIGGTLQETVEETLVVVQPVEFSFAPEIAPGTVSEPTPWGQGPAAFPIGSSTRVSFRFRNIGTPGFSVEGLDFNVLFEGGPEESCERIEAYYSDGSVASAPYTLTNPNDYVTIDCYYRPLESGANLQKNVVITASYLANGTRVNIIIPNPVWSAAVLNIAFEVSLVGSGNTALRRTVADDDQTIPFNLLVENTGTVPLTNFNFSLVMRDLIRQLNLTGTNSALTPGQPPHTLNELWEFNQASGARCPDPLPQNSTCLISGTLPSHLLDAADLNYRVRSTDPDEFMFILAAEASTTTGVPVFATSDWTVRVARPMVEIGGQGPTRADNGFGNSWSFNRANFTTLPSILVMNQAARFNVVVRNTGFKQLSNIRVILTLNPGTIAQRTDDGFMLVSANAQTTPTAAPVTFPVTLNLTLTDNDLLPGESTVATGTWTVEGFTVPNSLIAQVRFQSDVAGNYRDYDVLSDAFLLPVAADPTVATTDPDGNALDPNATEPTLTKTVSVENANPNDTVTWTLEVTNSSTNPMSNIAVVDNVPGDLTVVDTATTTGAVITAGNLVSVSIGALEPGQRVTVTINTTVNLDASVPNLLTNRACATREGGTQVCAEVDLGIGASSDVNPATGVGTSSSFVPQAGRWAHLPFLVAASSLLVGLLFLSLSFTDRQRLMLMGLAALVVIVIIIAVLFLAGGGDGNNEGPAAQDGTAPAVVGQFPTATRVPTDEALALASPTPGPTFAPNVLAMIESFPPTSTPYILPTPAGPRRLDIPALEYALPIPIVELPLVNGEWDVANLGHNIGWLDQTTWLDPGWGNTVLAGHVQLSDTEPGPFEELDQLTPGDEILVLEGSTTTEFRVTEIFTVGPTETDVTKPTANPVLTLITCTNWDEVRGVFSDRLVVRAVPAELFDQANANEES